VTGFLARMAARAAGGAPAVSPRVPARFEPVAAIAPPEETLTVAAPSATPKPMATPSATPIPMATPNATPAYDDPVAASSQRRREEPAQTTDPPPMSPPPRDAQAPAPGGGSAAATGLVVGPPAGTPTTAASMRMPPTPTPREPSDPVLTAPGEEPSQVRPRPPAVVTATPTPQVADLLATLPTGDGSRRQERIARTASAPNVVHVSIGRVDVRATIASQAPAPPPTQPSNHPSEEALSLHDYLLGRRGAS
jgi:hypothetical protein